MNVTLTLTDDQLEAIAQRVAAIVGERQAPAPDDWIRGAQAAADYLGCPRSRVYDLVAQCRLEPHRDGRVLAFKRSELDRLMEAR